MTAKAVFYDASKCTGCKGCQTACKQWNQHASALTSDEFTFTGSYQSPLDVTDNTWLLTAFNEADNGNGVEWSFARRGCFHCTDAACEQACPVGAIGRAASGAVVIDESKCIGCRYCVNACPFGVPKWRETANKAFKCRMCQDRTANGRQPACVSTCPAGALAFGDRSEMVKEAEKRLSQVKSAGYDKAELYGVSELGGMHVITLAHRGLEAHGLVRDPKVPELVSLWQFLKPLGALAFGGAAAGLAISFLTGMGYERTSDEVEEVHK